MDGNMPDQPDRYRGHAAVGLFFEHWRAVGTRIAAAAFAWWMLSEGRADSWMVGAVAVATAVAVSLRLAPPGAKTRGRLRAALVFAAFFLLQSLRAGLQVAWLAISPRARLAPRGIDITLALPPGPSRFMLAGTLSLLPGTLSVKLDGSRLIVHSLTGLSQTRDEVRALEARIAPLFGVAT
jgi:multicomponent Na+:H+ antiporter subunit E